MKLNYITIMVRDIEKSINFYQTLVGLKIVRRFNNGKGEIVFMANADGDTMLEFIQFDDGPKVQTSGMTMSYKAEKSLEELRQYADELGYMPTEINDAGPKPAYFRVKDPDGIEVEFS